jgi:hypothetical protein
MSVQRWLSLYQPQASQGRTGLLTFEKPCSFDRLLEAV